MDFVEGRGRTDILGRFCRGAACRLRPNGPSRTVTHRGREVPLYSGPSQCLQCRVRRPGAVREAIHRARAEAEIPSRDQTRGNCSSIASRRRINCARIPRVAYNPLKSDRLLADQFTKSCFRLQDLPDGDMSLNVDFDSGPTLGRCFALYYNQAHIGRLEIYPSCDYTTKNPNVYTDVRIKWSRFLGSYELMEILGVITMHVISNNPKSVESLVARQSIHYALTETLWGNYRISQYDRHLGDVEDWGDLKLSFHGVAEFYIAQERPSLSRGGSVSI